MNRCKKIARGAAPHLREVFQVHFVNGTSQTESESLVECLDRTFKSFCTLFSIPPRLFSEYELDLSFTPNTASNEDGNHAYPVITVYVRSSVQAQETFVHELLHAFDCMVGKRIGERHDLSESYCTFHYTLKNILGYSPALEALYPRLTRSLDGFFEYLIELHKSGQAILRQSDEETFAYIGEAIFSRPRKTVRRLPLKKIAFPLKLSDVFQHLYIGLVRAMVEAYEDCALPAKMKTPTFVSSFEKDSTNDGGIVRLQRLGTPRKEK